MSRAKMTHECFDNMVNKELIVDLKKEKKRAYRRAYYEANRNRQIADSKAWQKANKDKKIAYDKAYHEANLDKRKAYSKAWRKSNPDKVKIAAKVWHRNNRDKINAYRKVYVKKRWETDPLFRATYAIRTCVTMALKDKGYARKSKTESILGCSFEEFKTYIEQKFTKDMTWLNHGEWHLDHIIPMSSGKNEAEVIKLNHYTNLQPLWATTEIAEKHGEIDYVGNLEKSNKYE